MSIDCANPPCITSVYSTQNLNKRSLKQSTKEVANDFNKFLEVKNSRISNASVVKDGTDLAIKKLAKEMEQQFLGFLWNSAVAASGPYSEGSIGEEIFRAELTNEIVKNSREEMSELAQQIYKEAKATQEANNANKK